MSTRQDRLPEGRWTAVVAALLLLPALVLWLASRGPDPGDTDPEAQSSQTRTDDPVYLDEGMVHVHGLGVNPGDGTLYAATHFGVFAVADGGTATRVGNAQDTMGFTITGPDTFLGLRPPRLRPGRRTAARPRRVHRRRQDVDTAEPARRG